MPTEFIRRGKYTRDQVADAIGMPEQRRGGSWDTGYDEWNGEFFLFCNVGVPGRTGHDYQNRWLGDRLSWFAKNGTRLSQPQITSLLSGALPVHIFWRGRDRAPFSYAGLGLAEAVSDTSPVEVTWLFDDEVLAEPSLAKLPLWKRGPPPSLGERMTHKVDGPTSVYLMVLDGASTSTFPDLPAGMQLAKIGMSNDAERRLIELNSGFPPGCVLKWRLVRSQQYPTGIVAYAEEGEILEQFRAADKWVGGEFVHASPQDLSNILTGPSASAS